MKIALIAPPFIAVPPADSGGTELLWPILRKVSLNLAWTSSSTPMVKRKHEQNPQTTLLKGWKEIAGFLGQPVSVAQRWGKDGMLVRRDGRCVTATPGDLNNWLIREAGSEPLHIATGQPDPSADLKRGLAYLKSHKKRALKT